MASIITDATSPRCRCRRGCGTLDEHGTPERVLYADGAPLPSGSRTARSRMPAAPVEDDLNRVATPLAVLNDFPPFNRTANSGSRRRCRRRAARGRRHRDRDGEERPHPPRLPLEVSWVVVRPDARLALLGTWSTLVVADASRLLVDPSLM